MIRFLNEDVRVRFHNLPVDTQREWLALAAKHDLTVLFVDDSDGLEISVRIDEKLNPVGQ